MLPIQENASLFQLLNSWYKIKCFCMRECACVLPCRDRGCHRKPSGRKHKCLQTHETVSVAALPRSVNRTGLGLVFEPRHIAQLMLTVSRSLSSSWSVSSPLPCAAQGCPGPGGTWHAPQQRGGETPQWAFKGDNTTGVVTWIASAERHW